MKRFLCRSFIFLTILGGLLGGACFFLADTNVGKTMLSAQREKVKMLAALDGDRVILVGGSSCAQGFATSNLCAALNRPVYNMGLHAGLGLIYQMKSVEPLVRKGDIVILIPEYANFDGTSCFGEEELLMMVVDVMPGHKKLLSFGHWLRLLPLVPKYGADKLRHLFLPPRTTDHSKEFDSFGDRLLPANVSFQTFIIPPVNQMGPDDFSPAILSHIQNFVETVGNRGGVVYIMPPAYLRSAYERQSGYIQCIADRLKNAGVAFAAPPEHFVLDGMYFHDTPYHLNRAGRELRSRLLVERLRGVLVNPSK